MWLSTVTLLRVCALANGAICLLMLSLANCQLFCGDCLSHWTKCQSLMGGVLEGPTGFGVDGPTACELVHYV